jgi:spermidine/putrescine transport system permease protein
MIVPYGYMFYFSFLKKAGYSIEHVFNLNNYVRVFTNPLYLSVILNSARIAALVTILSVVIGYALAFFIAYIAKPRHKRLFYFLVIIPLWSSFLLRVFIWKLILGREGLINVALLSSGVIEEPLTIILYNDFSVILTLTYIFIPFVALPVYAALEKIPPNYIEASMDLGGGPLTTFRKVVLPMSLPGLLTGATFTFCLSFGDFVTPTLLGGASGIMIADVIISQFLVAFEWPFGSALAVTLLVAVLIPIVITSRLEKRNGGQIV